MNEEKEIKIDPKKKREIIIHTDGNTATIVKAEVSGSLELKAIITGLAEKMA